MKVVNPLFRSHEDAETAAHSSCACICNAGDTTQHNLSYLKAFTPFVNDCGCGCDSSIAYNDTKNSQKADAKSNA